MDIVLRAQHRREELKSELARIESFLATAFELQQELSAPGNRLPMSDSAKADAPAAKLSSRGGTGAETLKAVTEILIQRGQPLSTRELLPLVLARGIEVGGKDPIATLSARISSKGVVILVHGKWWLNQENTGAPALAGSEAADLPGKERSAASLFSASQGERRDAAALAN